MLVSTFLMFHIIVIVWKRSILPAFSFVLFFGSIELVYFSSCIARVPGGAWLPLILSSIILSIMSIWHYGTWKKEAYESQNKLSVERLLSLGPSLGIIRVPGIGLVYSKVVSGVPPMFAHFVTNFPAFHRILVFVSLQGLTVPKVPPGEQFLIGRIGPPDYRLFRCIVRYGYKDARRDSHDFENQLITKIGEFLQQEGELDMSDGHLSMIGAPSTPVANAVCPENGVTGRQKKVTFKGVRVKEEVKELVEAREAGMAYMMGQTCVVASDTSSWAKKFVIDIVYSFLRRNCRRPAVALGIPHTSLIEVGMVYSM